VEPAAGTGRRGWRGRIDLRPGEAPSALWAAAMFFTVLASYFVLRPVRDSLALDGDPAFIPWLFTATCAAMLLVAPVWGALVARWPRRIFVPVVYRFFLVNLLVFFALIRAEVAPALIGRVFYVWSSVFNLFVVSVFWSLLADAFSTDQARRLYGPIAVGGTAGAFLGPILTGALVERVGVAGVLLVSAALIEAAVQCSRRLAARTDASPTRAPDEPLRGHALAGLGHVVRSPFLAGIVVYVLCTTFAATFIYMEQAQIVHDQLADREARTAYFAWVDAATNGATLVIQLALTAPLLHWLGAGLVLAILPLVQGVGVIALVSAPALATLAAAQIAGRSITHGLARPARELLFTTVSREDKFKAKNVIDTLIFRFGDFAAAWFQRGLGALGLTGAGLIAVAAPLAAGWLATALLLGRAFRARTSTARSDS
jgi:AAA family ATP:ADP antiporter